MSRKDKREKDRLNFSKRLLADNFGKETKLSAALRKRSRQLEGQITELHMAKALCDKMLTDTNISYEKLQVEQYVTKIPEYWSKQENQKVFKLDSVSFLYLWGSFFVWGAITVLCLLVSILSYGKLPQEIPVQWSGDTAVSLADRKVIFVFPAVCIVIRYLVRTSLYAKTRMFYYLLWRNTGRISDQLSVLCPIVYTDIYDPVSP